MTTVTTDAHTVYPMVAAAPDRTSHRYSGILIAISASVVLWAGIGTGIWGLVSLFD